MKQPTKIEIYESGEKIYYWEVDVKEGNLDISAVVKFDTKDDKVYIKYIDHQDNNYSENEFRENDMTGCCSDIVAKHEKFIEELKEFVKTLGEK